jgi:hypothetical protein
VIAAVIFVIIALATAWAAGKAGLGALLVGLVTFIVAFLITQTITRLKPLGLFTARGARAASPEARSGSGPTRACEKRPTPPWPAAARVAQQDNFGSSPASATPPPGSALADRHRRHRRRLLALADLAAAHGSAL